MVRNVGATRSPAAAIFFEVELLALDEVPDRPMIDLEAALGEFGDNHYKRRPADFPRQAISQIVAAAAKNWLCFAKKLNHSIRSCNFVCFSFMVFPAS